MKERHMMGKIGDLHVTADRSAAGGFLLLWAVFSLLGRGLYHLRPRAAITGGLLATGLHFLSELWHQMGHARAAEHTGFPMTGIHLWGMLGTSIILPMNPSCRTNFTSSGPWADHEPAQASPSPRCWWRSSFVQSAARL